ncbi:MAG TPA: MBL fold metallo-hydrolase RNA specificity domain-containing protein, partial [Candidatus Paceibacterota bacterium]
AGEEIKVKAKVVNIMCYSGHKDSDALINFVEEMQETVKKVFVVMGEPKSSLFLAQKLKDNLGLEAETPSMGDSVTLEL